MGWKEELWGRIEQEWDVGEVFKSRELYKYEDHLADLYPENNQIQSSIRRTLQRLENEGRISSAGFGEYRREE